jgi:hypothetical protein
MLTELNGDGQIFRVDTQKGVLFTHHAIAELNIAMASLIEEQRAFCVKAESDGELQLKFLQKKIYPDGIFCSQY